MTAIKHNGRSYDFRVRRVCNKHYCVTPRPTPLFCLLFFCFDILIFTNTKLNLDQIAIIFLNITAQPVAYRLLSKL
jgi:hypothetical protein